MLKGDASVSPEYTGTGWINCLGNEQPIKHKRAHWQAVNEADQPNHLTLLPPAPVNNTSAVAIRKGWPSGSGSVNSPTSNGSTSLI